MDNKNLAVIKLKNGKNYSVRQDRTRYFFPQEWDKFISTFKNDKSILLYNTLLNTCARIMEALHLKPSNFDFQRETITFEVVKSRKANKKLLFASGKKRSFFVSDKYIKLVKAYVKKYNIASDDYLFINKQELPENYATLTNLEKNKYFKKTKVSYHMLMKSHLKKANITNYQDFSLHNIRKTYGNWMRTFNIDMQELCYRLGHDYETFMSNYGSSLMFNESDKIKIRNIMGNVK